MTIDPPSVELDLGGGNVVLVDADDVELVTSYRWRRESTHSRTGRRIGYMVSTRRVNGEYIRTYLHRLVCPPLPGQMTDHISGDTMDNRKSNLRSASRSQNIANSRKRRDNVSGFKGVRSRLVDGRWQARIRHSGKEIALGVHDTPELAARAYDEAARKYFREFARLNFPDIDEQAA